MFSIDTGHAFEKQIKVLLFLSDPIYLVVAMKNVVNALNIAVYRDLLVLKLIIFVFILAFTKV